MLVFGVAAAMATFHDVLTVLGIFYLLDKEITLLVVTALLTLAGYSLTETVVVFDRIRENLHKKSRLRVEPCSLQDHTRSIGSPSPQLDNPLRIMPPQSIQRFRIDWPLPGADIAESSGNLHCGRIVAGCQADLPPACLQNL